jgi:phospholipase/lecithinase/hemolysin
MLQELYDLGGRNFIVSNLAPIGCYPAFLKQLLHNARDVDSYGCMISYNKAVMDYNRLLLQSLDNIRGRVPSANVVYFDKYAVLLELFQNPKAHGKFTNQFTYHHIFKVPNLREIVKKVLVVFIVAN